MTQDAAAIIWALGILAWVIIRLPHRRRARKTQVVAERRSLSEQTALGLCILGLVIIPALHLATGLLGWADYPFHPLLGWFGVATLIGFLVLFYLCHKHLARNWSVTLEIREGHELVQTGVYSLVRHPMYTSFWLWGIAQALLVPNLIAGLAGLLSVAWLYFSRINEEEALMHEQFGAAYEAYCRKTARLVPKLY